MTLRYKLTWTHASKSLQLRPLPTPQLSTNVLLEAKGRHRIIQYRFSHQAEDCLENFVLVLSAKKVPGCRCHSFSEKFDLRYNNIQLERNN